VRSGYNSIIISAISQPSNRTPNPNATSVQLPDSLAHIPWPSQRKKKKNRRIKQVYLRVKSCSRWHWWRVINVQYGKDLLQYVQYIAIHRTHYAATEVFHNSFSHTSQIIQYNQAFWHVVPPSNYRYVKDDQFVPIISSTTMICHFHFPLLNNI